MLKNAAYIILGFFSLALSRAVRHTPIFFIDFTQTPEQVQLFVSWTFFLIFALLIIASAWRFVENE